MKAWGCLATIVFALLLLACSGMTLPAEAAFFLIAGWVFFFSNVWPQLTISWSGLATAIVALGVFVAGLQRLGEWWMSALPVQDHEQPHRPWRWRWTMIATAAVILSFTAGIALVGATHQIAWMATSQERLIGVTSEAVWRAHSRNNLREIGEALHNYLSTYQRFPSGGTFGSLGRPLVSWQTALLPYMGESNLYARLHLDLPWDAPENADALATHVKPYQIWQMEPGDLKDAAGRSLTHYAGNGRILNAGAGLSMAGFKDGVTETIMAGEAKARYKPWGYPMNWRDVTLGINRSPDGFGSQFKEGAHFLFADGSVRFMSDRIDEKSLEALATPDGGEDVGEW